jgi:hypothetical protein
MVERKSAAAGVTWREACTTAWREGGSGGGANLGKVWSVRRQSKDDALFAHLQWRGPEFYIKSLKLLLSSSMVSLTFGASLFSADIGALNIIVALSLAPSLFAIYLTPTILDMYKCALAATADSQPSTHSGCTGTKPMMMAQQVAQGVRSSLSTVTKQVQKDVDCAAVAVITAACTVGAIHMHMYNMAEMDSSTWSTILVHAQDKLWQNEWMRDTLLLLRAVEDLPVVLRENIESMFPRAKPWIKMSPMMTQIITMCSAMSLIGSSL